MSSASLKNAVFIILTPVLQVVFLMGNISLTLSPPHLPYMVYNRPYPQLCIETLSALLAKIDIEIIVTEC